MPKTNRDCCYEEMAKETGGQSIPQPYWPENPAPNEYEANRKGWNANGYDQSGMKGSK